MAKKLKVFQTSLGFFDQAIAAPSMKAALEAWGADSSLFHQGAAKETTDRDVVAATMAKPGVVLRRPVGSSGRFTEHAALPTDLGNDKAERKPKDRPAKSKKRPAKADDKAARRAAQEYEKAERQRENDRRKEEASRAKERQRREQAFAKAKVALEKAEVEHDSITASSASRASIAMNPASSTTSTASIRRSGSSSTTRTTGAGLSAGGLFNEPDPYWP